MAKSGKHKKLRRQEKAKTQLKGGIGKTLGKAQNVIEPKLQTKKIILREQLKSVSEGEILSRRKRSIHEVLTSLNHHNCNTKTEALSSLHELITTEFDVVDFHLGKIIDKLAQLTSDMEAAVRKENLRVAQVLFSQISEEQLQPFWNLLLTHLKCTLTDLSPSVRQSSLSFITMLVEQCPTLVAGSKSGILPVILNLISSTTKSPSTSSSSGTTTTKLKVDIEDKTTEIRERIRVLSLISTCLNLKLESPSRGSNEIMPEGTLLGYNALSSVYAELYYPFGYTDENYGKNLSFSGDSVASGHEIMTQDPVEVGTLGMNNSAPELFLVKFIHSCLPVLCETWVEVAPSTRPSPSSKKIEGKTVKKRQAGLEGHQGENTSHLNKSAVEVLKCVVDVMVQLLNLRRYEHTLKVRRPGRRQKERLFSQKEIRVEKFDSQVMDDDCVASELLIRELRKTFGQDLQKYFFNFLPFSCVHDGQRQSMVTVNLQLFHVAASLRLVDPHLMDEFEKYIEGMMKKDVLNPDQVALVLETASLIRFPRIGMLCSKFIVFSIQTGNQELIYNFLEKILSLKSTPEDAKFADSIDWQYLYPHIIEDLTSESNESLISVLTLITIKNHLSMGPILKENLEVFRSVLASRKNSKSDSIYRLFYYADSLELLSSLVGEHC